LYLNIDKCQFKQSKVDYLGVHVGGKKIRMEEAKVKKVKHWKPPHNATKVRRFLGFTGYYCYFIKGYSQIARPLLDLTKQSTTWHWGTDLLRSDPTPTLFSSSSLTYSAPDTWDTPPPSPTVVSEFPDVVPTHPLDILPRVAPEPFSLGSLM
jgi:hypothetical protein